MKRLLGVLLCTVLMLGSGAGIASAQFYDWPGDRGQALPPSPYRCGPYNNWYAFLSEGQIMEFDIRVDRPGAWIEFNIDIPGSTSRQSSLFSGYIEDSIHLEYRVPEGASGVHSFDLYNWEWHKMTFAWTATDRLDMDGRIERVAGDNRYETALSASQWGWGSDEATTVVVATGSKYADALASSSLAGINDCPILLTRSSYNWAETYRLLEELDRLGAEKVYLIGGMSVVPQELATRIETAENGLQDPNSTATLDWVGATVERIGGSDRYQTAALVAEESVEQLEANGSFNGSVFIASGEKFADSLAAAPYSAATGMPLLLVRRWTTPQVTHDTLQSIVASDAIVVGGTSVVSPITVDELGIDSMRIAGTDRYKTSLALTEYALAEGWGDISVYGLATGYTYPDSLPGGAATAHNGGVLLLTPPNTLSNDAALHLNGNKTDIGSIPVFGGIGAVTGVVTGEVHFFIQ